MPHKISRTLRPPLQRHTCTVSQTSQSPHGSQKSGCWLFIAASETDLIKPFHSLFHLPPHTRLALLVRLNEAFLQVVLPVFMIWHPNAPNPVVVELVENVAPFVFALKIYTPLQLGHSLPSRASSRLYPRSRRLIQPLNMPTADCCGGSECCSLRSQHHDTCHPEQVLVGMSLCPSAVSCKAILAVGVNPHRTEALIMDGLICLSGKTHKLLELGHRELPLRLCPRSRVWRSAFVFVDKQNRRLTRRFPPHNDDKKLLSTAGGPHLPLLATGSPQGEGFFVRRIQLRNPA